MLDTTKRYCICHCTTKPFLICVYSFAISITDQQAATTANASTESMYDNFPVPSTRNKSVQENGTASPKLSDHLFQNNLDIGSMVEVRVNLLPTIFALVLPRLELHEAIFVHFDCISGVP